MAAKPCASSAITSSKPDMAEPDSKCWTRHPEIRLLFTDIGLPGGMNGRQLADEARKRRPNLRVLFTTAYARNAIVHDGRLDPGVELLPKPYTQSALAAKVRDIIDARQSPGRILLVEDEDAHSDAGDRIS